MPPTCEWKRHAHRAEDARDDLRDRLEAAGAERERLRHDAARVELMHASVRSQFEAVRLTGADLEAQVATLKRQVGDARQERWEAEAEWARVSASVQNRCKRLEFMEVHREMLQRQVEKAGKADEFAVTWAAIIARGSHPVLRENAQGHVVIAHPKDDADCADVSKTK